VALGGFGAAFGDVGGPVDGEVAAEQEDLFLVVAQPAAQRVAGVVPSCQSRSRLWMIPEVMAVS